MGFAPKGVWVMGYCGCMDYGMHFSANRLGGPKNLWGIREYGLSELWVMRESTVQTEPGQDPLASDYNTSKYIVHNLNVIRRN